MRTVLTAAMVVSSTMFKVYDPPNSETRVSKLFLNFPVVNTTCEAIHVQFQIKKLVFTIISIAPEGSIRLTPRFGWQVFTLIKMNRTNRAIASKFGIISLNLDVCKKILLVFFSTVSMLSKVLQIFVIFMSSILWPNTRNTTCK